MVKAVLGVGALGVVLVMALKAATAAMTEVAMLVASAGNEAAQRMAAAVALRWILQLILATLP